MIKNFRKVALTTVMALGGLSLAAQENVIEGYFRIQTLAGAESGNTNYVEVTGPFTAKPNLSYEDAEKSAGTIMYVTAVQDGGSYKLTSLRCQGIDVAKDDVDPDQYANLLADAIKSGDSPVYAIMRAGFQHGYTSIARATVGSVFWIVATALEGYATDNIDPNAYVEVTEDFNRNVTANLDLGIRLLPVEGKERTVQVYFDVPSLQPVCDWYNDPTQTERHDTFASAMKAMTNFLDGRGINLETFLPSDISLFNDWGFDINEISGLISESDGRIVTDFNTIFSNAELLFNWIKWVGYYIINPDKDPEDRFPAFVENLPYNFGSMAGKVKDHYLTSLLADYLPRLHSNTRAFLINGRVYNDEGNVNSGGTTWNSADNTLGFANEREVAIAGDNGKWVLQPVDNETQKFVIDHKHSFEEVEPGYGYSALYFDFPVSAAADQKTNFYTMSADLYYVEQDGYKYVFNKTIDLDNSIAAQTPFIMETTNGGSTQLLVADGKYTFTEIDAPETLPDNSIVISDEESTKQYSVNSILALNDNAADTSLKGVLLPTTQSNMANYWDETDEVYPFSQINDHVGFKPDSDLSLGANEAYYVPTVDAEPIKSETMPENTFVYIGEPEKISDTSAIGSIIAETEKAATVIYDLRGMRVEKPQPGNIYIINGEKVLLF